MDNISSHLHLRSETHALGNVKKAELLFLITRRWTKSGNSVIASVINHRQKLQKGATATMAEKGKVIGEKDVMSTRITNTDI
jgi:hypothetical protein